MGIFRKIRERVTSFFAPYGGVVPVALTVQEIEAALIRQGYGDRLILRAGERIEFPPICSRCKKAIKAEADGAEAGHVEQQSGKTETARV